MIAKFGQVIVGGRCLEDGRVAIWNVSMIPLMTDWVTALFGKHEASWYGTMLPTVEDGPFRGVALEPREAIDYLADPKPLAHVKVEWDRSGEMLRAQAGRLRPILRNAWYAPSFADWKDGRARFRIALPEGMGGESGERSERETAADEAWLNAALRNVAANDEELAALIARMEAPPPNAEAAALWEEEDWYDRIGFSARKPIVKTALRLSEPKTDEGDDEWTIEWHTYEIDPLRAEEASAVAASRVQRWMRWMKAIAPELVAEKDGVRTLVDRLDADQAWRFLSERSLMLAEMGMSVQLPAWWEELQRLKPRLRASVKSSVGAMADGSKFSLHQLAVFDWKLAVGDDTMTEEALRAALRRGSPLVRVGRRWVHLDAELAKELKRRLHRADQRGLTMLEALRLHWEGADSAAEAEPVAAEERRLVVEAELSKQLLDWTSSLESIDRIPIRETPEGLQGELRPYQTAGMSWMAYMYQYGLGCCLADDMGLGKTVMWIGYFLTVKREFGFSSPALLVCPTSVLGNWQKELERFAPELSVRVHHGPGRPRGEAFAAAIEGCDVVLTSYALAHLDEEELAGREWAALCLDEAQNIKNAYTKQATALRRVPAQHRVALTGTPVENRLTELWSIYDFLLPGYLGTLPDFQRTFAVPIERGDAAASEALKRLMRPFLLRRTKTDPSVSLSLPEKLESNTYVNLSAEAAALYKRIVQEALLEAERNEGLERRAIVLRMLLRLKQICDYPALLSKDPEPETEWNAEAALERSGKLRRLMEMLDEAVPAGDRCLIFTQYVGMGRLLQRCVTERFRLEETPFLHGGVSKSGRDRMIEAFQRDDGPPVLILSLKAGGVGLNLTAAQHVFHYDRWWNPAVEDQATDRAYRIGQTRTVQVHKLITIGTMEERIDELLQRKRELHRAVIGAGEQWITELPADELRSLVALRAT